MSELAIFEGFCETLYNSPHAEERAKAEHALVQLSTTPEYIPKCQFVLSNSTVPYAQLVAGNALKRLLHSSWNHLSTQQRTDYRNYVSRLAALFSHPRTTASFLFFRPSHWLTCALPRCLCARRY